MFNLLSHDNKTMMMTHTDHLTLLVMGDTNKDSDDDYSTSSFPWQLTGDNIAHLSEGDTSIARGDGIPAGEEGMASIISGGINDLCHLMSMASQR
jgi:hypothetical protein